MTECIGRIYTKAEKLPKDMGKFAEVFGFKLVSGQLIIPQTVDFDSTPSTPFAHGFKELDSGVLISADCLPLR